MGPIRRRSRSPPGRPSPATSRPCERAGGEAVLIDPQAGARERARAFAEMDGLLLPGGADLDPARYGQPPHPATLTEAGRDELEAAAWQAARDRGLPVLGVCRGMQAINVFSGGSLVQDVDGHDSPLYPSPEAHAHPVRLIGQSRLAGILGLDDGSDDHARGQHLPPPGDPSRPGGRRAGGGGHHAGRRAGGSLRGRRSRGRGSSASRTTRSARSSRRRSSPACGRRSSRRQLDRQGG